MNFSQILHLMTFKVFALFAHIWYISPCGLVGCTSAFHPAGWGSIPHKPQFYSFFQFFQTLRAKKGHNRHVKPCLLLYIVLHIVQRSFWHRSDRGALRCKNLTFVRENRHFWSYFTSFFNFGSLKKFCSAIKASNHI